jgi:hypothetical protein
MSQVEQLVEAYQRFARLPWQENLAGAQKVWFVIYDPAQERRLRLRVNEFETATRRAGHEWKLVDLTDAFAGWMAQHKYREAYFESPDMMDLALQDFAGTVSENLAGALTAGDARDNTVVALLGVGSLFGLASVSSILEGVTTHVRGRLLVFFPGHREGSNYRLLDARDGWNYLATPITATDGI